MGVAVRASERVWFTGCSGCFSLIVLGVASALIAVGWSLIALVVAAVALGCLAYGVIVFVIEYRKATAVTARQAAEAAVTEQAS